MCRGRRVGYDDSLHHQREREITSYRGELMSGWLISYRGNQQRGRALTAPLIRTISSWGLEQVCRKFNYVSRVWVKQAVVEQGVYREQENSCLEWPGHTCTNKGMLEDRKSVV